MYDHQLNYWISKHFQMGLVIKGLTLATVMDFGVLTSTKISAAVVSLLTSSLLLMLWFWRRGVNLPSWSSHLRVRQSLPKLMRKIWKISTELKCNHIVTTCYQLVRGVIKVVRSCTLELIWKDKTVWAKQQKLLKNRDLKKLMNQEMNITLQLYITIWWYYGNCQGERFHY